MLLSSYNIALFKIVSQLLSICHDICSTFLLIVCMLHPYTGRSLIKLPVRIYYWQDMYPECVQMCTFNLLFNKQRNHRNIKLYRIQICTSFAWTGLPIIKPHFLLRIYKHKFVFIKCILNLIRKLSLHKPFQAAYGHCVGIFLHLPDKTFHCKVRILINNTYSSESSFSHCKPDNCRV